MRILYRSIIVVCFLQCLPLHGAAQQSALPWLKNIDPKEQVKNLHTLRTEAGVRVSDGLTYQTSALFHDKQRAVFQQVYNDRTIARAVEGRYLWAYDGQTETEAGAWAEGFILGHQFQAQILFFDKIQDSLELPESAVFAGKSCQMLAGTEAQSEYKFYYDPAGLPLGMEILTTEGDTIAFMFEDWRPVSDILLPFVVLIDDGSRTFEYRFSKIELNAGSLAEFRAPEPVLTEEQKLLRRHRAIMDDHFFGRTEALQALSGDSTVVLSEGEVYKMSGEQFHAGFARMMGNRDYVVYDDLIRPVVKISKDGTLGWVTVQILAKGVRFDAAGQTSGPLEFVCAWVELYEKVGEEWKLVGNVSNFRPGRQ